MLIMIIMLTLSGGEGQLAPPVAHLLQPVGPPALQELRAARGEAQVRHRGD